MQKKSYYRLNELQQYFGIAPDEIRYLVEQRMLQLSFFYPESKFVAGEDEFEYFIGNCVVNYEGIVTLTCDDSIRVFSNGFVDASHLTLADRAPATLETRNYPFTVKYPNNYVENWSSKKLGELPEKDIPAKVLATEDISLRAAAKNAFINIAEPESVGTHFSKLPKTLYPQTIRFSIESACVTHRHLSELKLINHLNKELSDSENSESKPLAQLPRQRRNSDLHDLLAKILLKHTNQVAGDNISQKECLRVLESESSLAPTDRQYDTDGILEKVTDTMIYWSSDYKENQKLQIDNLSSTMSKIKKKLKSLGKIDANK